MSKPAPKKVVATKKPSAKAPAKVAVKAVAKVPVKAAATKTAAARKAASKPVVPKALSKMPAMSKPKPKPKPKAKAGSTEAPTKSVKAAAKDQASPSPPTVTGIVGVSTEKGIFLVVSTDQGAAELFDFRLAVKEPYPRAINAGAAKCRRATAVVNDSSTTPTRSLYLAFVSVPSATALEGGLLCRARTNLKQEVFFNVPTQRYQSFEADKITRVLAALSDGFDELLVPVLGAAHPLIEQFAVVIKRKTELEFWNAVRQKVKDLLQGGQGQQALEVLEPLVYARTPHLQAEKLLGELLYSSAKKPEASQDGPGQQALQQLMTETVLLQWYLKRQQIATDT